MSVIVYENEKFYMIAATLKIKVQDIAHLWKYPGGWRENGLYPHIEEFVQKLKDANIQASNERYNKDNESETLRFPKEYNFYLTDYQFVKSLQGLAYNCVEAEEDEDFIEPIKKLHDIIHRLLFKIVNRLPEYERADTW